MKTYFSTIFSLIILLLLSANISAAEKLEAHDAWVREAPPNATVMAAYLTLHNHSTKTYTIVSAASPDFKHVEMHRTEQHDGMAKMVPISRVILSPKGSVSFQPGGMHLMLMKPKKPLKAGDTVSLTLFFLDESSITLSVPVKKDDGNMGHDMMEHDMQHMHDQHDSHKD